jgi:hypothetical protein
MSKKSVIFSQIYVFENSFGIYKMNLSRHDTTHEARPVVYLVIRAWPINKNAIKYFYYIIYYEIIYF